MYNKIKTIIEKGGLDVIVQDKRGYYAIFSTVTTNGDMRYSRWNEVLKDCKNTIGKFVETREEIEVNSKDCNWKIVKTIARQSNYEVGDKVRVKMLDFSVGRIVKANDCTKLYRISFDNNNYDYVDADYRDYQIEPYFEEEETEEMTLKEVCKEIGRNIKIIK